jgi:hypothetical protein
MPGLVNMQPSRFATILFYLNDDMEGGETLSSVVEYETSDALKVKTGKGKAILFYNLCRTETTMNGSHAATSHERRQVSHEFMDMGPYHGSHNN